MQANKLAADGVASLKPECLVIVAERFVTFLSLQTK